MNMNERMNGTTNTFGALQASDAERGAKRGVAGCDWSSCREKWEVEGACRIAFCAPATALFTILLL